MAVDPQGTTRVTVVIPTYNRADLLPGAIESVLMQTYGDLRLVVSDNASTDGTSHVVASFEDPRVSYVRQPRNLDLNSHFNLWPQRLETEYLVLLPDDDRLLPHAIETMVPVLDCNSRVGFVHGQVDVVDAAGALIAGGHDMTGLVGDAIESGADFIRRSMRLSYRVHASTALVRTAAIAPWPLEQADYPLTDLGQWMRIALDWDVAFVAQPLAEYRVHAGSYSSGAAQVTAGGYVQGVERIVTARDVKLRLLRDHGPRLDHLRRLRAAALRAFRRELLEQVAEATVPTRSLRSTARALARCGQLDRLILLEPRTWTLIVGCVLGRRGVSAARRLRGRLQLARGT